jgi:hypothetical protein
VAVGAAAAEQPAALALRIVGFATRRGAADASPSAAQAVDAHRQRQALDQCLRTCDIRRRADVAGQVVHVVGDQRPHHHAPAAGQRTLHAARNTAVVASSNTTSRAQRATHALAPAPAQGTVGGVPLQARTPAKA